MAHIRQSRPDSGIGFQVKVKPFMLFPFRWKAAGRYTSSPKLSSEKGSGCVGGSDLGRRDVDAPLMGRLGCPEPSSLECILDSFNSISGNQVCSGHLRRRDVGASLMGRLRHICLPLSITQTRSQPLCFAHTNLISLALSLTHTLSHSHTYSVTHSHAHTCIAVTSMLRR